MMHDKSKVLLDTSIQVDRVKMRNRRDEIERRMSNYDESLGTSIGLLEFKATIIRECVTIHTQLLRKKRFAIVHDSLCEKRYRQSRLRNHIFNNILCVFASSFELDEQQDIRLAEKARLRLEQIIPELYRWYSESVTNVLNGLIACDRATETPRLARTAFATLLPMCRDGENKSCNIEKVIRKVFPINRSKLIEAAKLSNQISRAVDIFEKICRNPQFSLTHTDCRSAGDCLIAFEAMGHATHVMSTNANEWEELAKIMNVPFDRVTYQDEKTV